MGRGLTLTAKKLRNSDTESTKDFMNRYHTVRKLINSKRRSNDWKKRERDEVGHSTQNDDDTASSRKTSDGEGVLQSLHGRLGQSDD